jgi:hypothetical protein
MKLQTLPTSLRTFAVTILLLGATLRGAAADVILTWNEAMTHYVEKQPPPGVPPFLEARAYAMAHLAMRNVATLRGRNVGIHAEAAVAQAAHDVLVAVLPGGASAFHALLSDQLAGIPDGTAKTRGIQRGGEEAASILAARAHDGSATPTGPYTPGDQPGDYVPTPPFDGPPFNGFVDAVNWGKVTPFAMKRGSQFRAPPPYAVTDLGYTFDFIEVKALGAASTMDLQTGYTQVALFWYENSPMAWNRIARAITVQHNLGLPEKARLFASLNAALADAYIASMDSKFAYNFWRPITAIHRADTDGNSATAADPAWEPLFLTPPVPDYPSGHAAAGGAAAAVLIATFGDEQTFTISSTMAHPFPELQWRTYHRISDAAKENALSRMLVGIHFRLACEV